MTAATVVPGSRASRHSVAVGSRKVRQLQRCPLFRSISDVTLRRVLECARVRPASRGGFYFRQGDQPVEIYVLLRGRVQLIRSGSGDRRAILGFVTPVEPFGYEDALGGSGHMVSAQASEDSAALAWPAAVLVRILTDHPVIAHNSFCLMAARIQEKWDRLHGMLTESLERRVARALLSLGATIGRRVEGSPAVRVMLAHRDLAAFVGATPYTTSRILSRWKRLRLIDGGRGWLTLWPRGLAAIAGDRRK